MNAKFTLHGVNVPDTSVGSSKANVVKYAAVKKKKGGRSVTAQSHEGYSVSIANVACVDFENGIKQQTCWWDHHPYDGDPICKPYDYVKKTNLGRSDHHHFTGIGSFCSTFCLWAYMQDEETRQYHLRDQQLDVAKQLTQIAHRAMYGTEVYLKAAPDWRLLDVYGGHLSIQEFRTACYNHSFVRLPDISFRPVGTTYLVE